MGRLYLAPEWCVAWKAPMEWEGWPGRVETLGGAYHRYLGVKCVNKKYRKQRIILRLTQQNYENVKLITSPWVNDLLGCLLLALYGQAWKKLLFCFPPLSLYLWTTESKHTPTIIDKMLNLLSSLLALILDRVFETIMYNAAWTLLQTISLPIPTKNVERSNKEVDNMTSINIVQGEMGPNLVTAITSSQHFYQWL